MTRVLLASDSWKGSLTAGAACAALREGARRVWPDAEFLLLPLADGGEGTVAALLQATGGQARATTVHGPRGESVRAQWGVLPDGRGVIEMAQASGLTLVPPSQRDALRASSRGTGELLRAAINAGCREILLGIGGSATTDGGSGALRALGARFLDGSGDELPEGGAALRELAAIETSGLDKRLQSTRLRVLCDVTNPLYGPNGAAHVYAPQKGASPAEVETLDAALRHFADVVAQTTGRERHDEPGAGAAGGIGFGLLSFAGAQLQPGIDTILEAIRFAEKLQNADLVLTGEGSLDAQTLSGKTIAGVTRAAKNARVPVIAFGGAVQLTGAQMDELGVLSAFPVADAPLRLEECIARAQELLANTAERVLRAWRK